jgi:hypothetical protein
MYSGDCHPGAETLVSLVVSRGARTLTRPAQTWSVNASLRYVGPYSPRGTRELAFDIDAATYLPLTNATGASARGGSLL